MATKSNITLPRTKSTAPEPEKAAPDQVEKKISEVINKGGSTTKQNLPQDPDKEKNFNIKVLQSELDAIQALREKRPKPRGKSRLGISLHEWIIEAIHEKIEREQKKFRT